MHHIEIIQKIIDRVKAKTYLEIGVETGFCFLRIKATHKVAVDPQFQIPLKQKLKWFIRNLGSRYFESTSDKFFEKIKPARRFDVIFIDGLHTYRQTLRDVENALNVLNENGVIIVHDCNPSTLAEAYPANSITQAAASGVSGWTGLWCGDVWKTVCHLRDRKDLQVFVLDCDFGVGIVTRGKPESELDITEAQLQKLTYDDLVKNRRHFLNLKSEDYFSEFLRMI